MSPKMSTGNTFNKDDTAQPSIHKMVYDSRDISIPSIEWIHYVKSLNELIIN